jgi:hypothetical protein
MILLVNGEALQLNGLTKKFDMSLVSPLSRNVPQYALLFYSPVRPDAQQNGGRIELCIYADLSTALQPKSINPKELFN